MRFVVAGFFAAPQASAQANASPDPLKFEVASIRVATSGFNGVRGGCRGIDSVYSAEEQKRGGIPPLGRYVITGARLSHLIGIAYGVSMQALDTGPDLEWTPIFITFCSLDRHSMDRTFPSSPFGDREWHKSEIAFITG